MATAVFIGYYLDREDISYLRNLRQSLTFSDPWMIKIDEDGEPIYGTQKLDRNFRSCSIADVDPKQVSHVTSKLVHLTGESIEARETTFSDYTVGDHFAYHVDQGEYAPQRKWTAITLLDKQDLEGGQLCLFDEETPYVLDLEVGETVMHCSTIPHKLTEITRGSRSVFISWYYPLTTHENCG